MRTLRSLLFLIGQSISAILYSPISMLAFPLPPLLRSRIIGGWAHFAIWWLRVTCNLSFTVRGLENLPDQPAVILSKHQSAWETIAFQLIFPPQAWVLKRELLWIPFFGWGLAASRPISINRSAGAQALSHLVREGTERLNEGRWVVVFPEGTRMPPGEHGRYNPGGAMLAVRSGAPIVPVAHNAGEFWPRRGFLKKPGVVTVAIGPRIDTKGRRPKSVNSEAEAWIKETMQRIAGR
ncbi:MAG: 1-acyl-sn-glycerol-3-phosphate acyltransferase [Gammaproteobacteria bacterium]|nr:1-acyl-sn-glycerol-3-phosphate acyltransferase [Gammaproteobacteria bacterium]MDH3464434.1 1-acyl-sn-glycerol-3-phosphate acyltransferase [Gammaproteobacteria bacterium]